MRTTTYAIPATATGDWTRGWLLKTDRGALAHGLRCISAGLVAEGFARVDALVAAGDSERCAVVKVAEQVADEIEATAKARAPLRTTDAGYHWQAGKAAAERATAEANAIHWLRTVAYELGALMDAETDLSLAEAA
jgi:hypothetical protein